MAKLLEEKKPSNLATTEGTSPYATALNASGQRPAEQGNFDYYENLKNESYKTLLKKEVQAAVAQDQARKYTANALNASGLGTQGIAQSTQLGIGNAYTTALNNAQNEYSQEILNINQQQRQEALNTEQAESNADYELLAGAIRNATTPEELAMIKERMAEFGFDDKSARSLNFLYELQNQQLSGSSITGAAYDGTTFYGYDKNGKTVTSADFKWENRTLTSAISNEELAPNSYVKMTNNKGETCYVYYGSNGTLTFVSQSKYDSATEGKYSIKTDGKLTPVKGTENSEIVSKTLKDTDFSRVRSDYTRVIDRKTGEIYFKDKKGNMLTEEEYRDLFGGSF